MREMKDSGIEWFGKIPKKWTIKPIKYLYTIRSGATPKSNDNDSWDGNIVWVTPADFKTEDKYISSGARNISEKGYRTCNTTLVPEKSIIFSKRAPIGTVVLSKGKLCTNQGCLSCVNNDTYNSLYYYYLMSILTEQFNLYGYGTTFMEISANNFANFKFVVPPKYEQDIIAKYLDKECAKYELITKDIQRQIEVLQEYKQSVITEAVTKGLDKNVAMKDSGIDWIGNIPQHWAVKKIKYIGDSRNGLTYKPTDIVDENDGTLVLRSSNIQDGKLTFNDNVYVSSIIPKNLKVKKDDILICSRNGSRELIGKNTLIDNVDATFGAFMMIYRCIAPRFIYYVLNSEVFKYYLGTFFTSTINQLTGTNFNNMKIVFCPNEKERQKITNYLDKKCSKLDAIIADKQKQLDTLTEYKKSLIYEYVTGKKEVPADA